jgi:hypothetical protein
MPKPVVGFEREIGATREDDARARHPVGLFAIDQVAHHVEGAECVRAFRGAGPGVIETGEQGTKSRRRAAQHFDG